LCTKSPWCFKEEIPVVRCSREVSAETFDKPPPRQLTNPTVD